MTSHIVQRLLKATCQEITRSNGSISNGENYHFPWRRNRRSVLSESAGKTMDMLKNNASIPNMLQYFTIAKESFEDRTLMMWMVNETEQAHLQQTFLRYFRKETCKSSAND